MQNLAIVYGAVIDDVLSKVRSEFVQEGNEPVVEELRALWEEKLLQTGVLDAASPEEYEEPVKEEQKFSETSGSGFTGPGPSVQFANPGLTVQHPGPLYQQPANVYISGQQYLQQNQHLQQPLRNPPTPQGPGSVAGHNYQQNLSNQANTQLPSGYRVQQPANAYVEQHRAAGQYAYGNGQPPQMAQQHLDQVADSRKRKAETLQVPYGADAGGPAQKQERFMAVNQTQSQLSSALQTVSQQIPPAIPQQDGPGDDSAPATEGASLDNLSDVEVDDDNIEKKMLPDYILGQYETVKRIKNRWRCTLNNAVMHLNGQDVVVTKAQGEFTF